MSKVNVRYIVNDVDAAIAFYMGQLGFAVDFHPSPGFARLTLGDLNLLLSQPGGGGGAGRTLDDGKAPAPGGWNRIQIEVEDLEALVAKMRAAGVVFRSAEIVSGNGGTQIIADDPSGNPIELFQPF